MNSIERVYHTKHDWGGSDPLSYTLITAVAAITGKEPTALPPLDHPVDPDALDALFAGTHERGHSGDFVSLTYAGCPVTIHRNGHIVLQLPRQ